MPKINNAFSWQLERVTENVCGRLRHVKIMAEYGDFSHLGTFQVIPFHQKAEKEH